MSEAWECTDCLRIFDKEEAYGRREVHADEFWGTPGKHVVVTDECPYCGSDQLDLIRLCEKCDLNPITDKREDWCSECLGKYAKEPTTLDPWMDALASELDQMVPR